MTEDTYRYTHYHRQMVWEGLIGHTVMITWRHIDPRDDPWERYRVVDADCEWIRLQGVDQQDDIGTSEYTGGPIVMRLADIEMAEIIQ